MNVLFNINTLNSEEMDTNYVTDFINKAEEVFDQWIEEKTAGLNAEQKTILFEKVEATKTAVKSTLDKAVKEFNGIMETVAQMAGTFPGSKLAIEYTEKKAKVIFEKAVDSSWDFLKNQLPLLIPKVLK